MKILMLIHIITLLLYGCSPVKTNEEVQEFIPGTYTRFSQHEFGTEHDTLVIILQNQSANEYRITRKWKYERLLDGVSMEPEYKIAVTSGFYNGRQKVLQENETRDIYSFDLKNKVLFNGPIKYQKL